MIYIAISMRRITFDTTYSGCAQLSETAGLNLEGSSTLFLLKLRYHNSSTQDGLRPKGWRRGPQDGIKSNLMKLLCMNSLEVIGA